MWKVQKNSRKYRRKLHKRKHSRRSHNLTNRASARRPRSHHSARLDTGDYT